MCQTPRCPRNGEANSDRYDLSLSDNSRRVAMILRSLTKHVRDQNWFAVGLDFLIVVVGVFIGIQVANWNEARADERLGKVYLDRLSSDLQYDLDATETMIAYYSAVVEGVLEADRLLSTANPDPRALVVAAYRASEVNVLPSNRATWDQIVSSGHLGLLPESVIDSGLSQYYSFTQSDMTSSLLQNAPYRIALRSIIDVPVQVAIRDGCSDLIDEATIIAGFVAECRLDVSRDVLASNAERLLSEPNLKDHLRYQYSLSAFAHLSYTGNAVLIRRAIAAIEALDQR